MCLGYYKIWDPWGQKVGSTGLFEGNTMGTSASKKCLPTPPLSHPHFWVEKKNLDTNSFIIKITWYVSEIITQLFSRKKIKFAEIFLQVFVFQNCALDLGDGSD